jgi:hypothetical protein
MQDPAHKRSASLLPSLFGLLFGLVASEEVLNPGLQPYVALAVARFASLFLERRGWVHYCSQYVTRPPLWHTKCTLPS